MVWINAVGNYAPSSWLGTAVDADGDSWIEFTSTDERNMLDLPANEETYTRLRWAGSWDHAQTDLAGC